MDGIALRFQAVETGLREFRIAGMAKAGARPHPSGGDADCIEVMTGAACPAGYDTVVPVEQIAVEGDSVLLRGARPIRRGQHIQPTGSDCLEGVRLVPEGAAMTPPRAAIAASVGCSSVTVTRTPRVLAICTGDEIVEAGGRPEPWQIRASNTIALSAMIGDLALTETRRSADTLDALQEKIRWGLEGSDLLILSGGVSAGKFDLVPAALERCGVTRIFHKAAIRPGKPIWFGKGTEGQPVFGLPGNPVSFMICFRRFVLPLLRALAGHPPVTGQDRIRLGRSMPMLPGMTGFHPVRILPGWGGEPSALPLSINGSGDFRGLGDSAGFIEIAEGEERVPEGEQVPFYPWAG
jgi:molybdopterin molybdotransferase